MRRLLIASVLFLATGCAIPERDNLRDPANAPVADLRVVEHTAADGSCLGPGAFGARDAVGAESRGRCLLLDARGSSDPQDTPVAELTISFAAPPCGDEAPFDAAAYAQTNGVIAIRNAYLRACVPEEPLTFGVTVSDPSHATSTSNVIFVPLNSPPVARILDPRRTLPLGGVPWAPDAPITVAFHGKAIDPDGDPFTLNWSFDPDLAGAPEGAVVTRDIPVDAPVRLLATLVANDNALDSVAVSTAVHVLGDPVFTYTAGPSKEIFLYDDKRRTVEPPYNPGFVSPGPRTAFASGANPFVAIHFNDPDDGGRVSTLLWPDGVFSTPLAADVSDAAIAADGTRSRVWVAGDDGASDRVLAWDAAPATQGTASVMALTPLVDVAVGTLTFTEDRFLVVDSAGNAWGSGFFSDVVRRITPAGGVLDHTPGGVVVALSARPGTGEVWALTIPLSITGQPPPIDEATLVAYGSDGTELRRVELGIPSAFGLAWADSERFWTAGPVDGLSLVGLETLALTNDFPTSALFRFPETGQVVSLVTDSQTGDCWTSSGADFTFLARIEGTLEAFTPPGSQTLPEFVDPLGAVWTVDRNDPRILVGHSTDANGVLAFRQLPSEGFPALDLVHGGLWLSHFIPPAIEFFGSDLESGRYLTSAVDELGAPFVLPFIDFLRISPDGGQGWLLADSPVAGYFLARVELQPDVPVVNIVETDPTELDGLPGPLKAQFFEASAPVPASTPFAWTTRELLSSDVEIRTVDESGVWSSRLTVSARNPNGDVELSGAMNLSDNSACVVYREQASFAVTGTAHVFHLGATTGAVELARIPLPADPDANAADAVLAGALSDDGDAYCWVGFSDGRDSAVDDAWQLTVVDMAGLVVHTHTTFSRLLSIRPTSRDEAWLVFELTGVSDGIRSYRITFDPGSVTDVTIDDLAANLAGGTALVSPGATAAE